MMGTACWPPMNMLPVSASAAEETTFCRGFANDLDGSIEQRASGGGVAEVEYAGDATACLS